MATASTRRRCGGRGVAEQDSYLVLDSVFNGVIATRTPLAQGIKPTHVLRSG
jgi:hypothetical protein